MVNKTGEKKKVKKNIAFILYAQTPVTRFQHPLRRDENNIDMYLYKTETWVD